MKRILFAASVLTIVAASSAYAAALTEKQVEGVETAIKAMECTVEETDIRPRATGYKADDVDLQGRPVRHAISTRTSSDQEGQRGLGSRGLLSSPISQPNTGSRRASGGNCTAPAPFWVPPTPT